MRFKDAKTIQERRNFVLNHTKEPHVGLMLSIIRKDVPKLVDELEKAEHREKTLGESLHLCSLSENELRKENDLLKDFVRACRYAGTDGLPQLKKDAYQLLHDLAGAMPDE